MEDIEKGIHGSEHGKNWVDIAGRIAILLQALGLQLQRLAVQIPL
jgi:hypothetical protein